MPEAGVICDKQPYTREFLQLFPLARHYFGASCYDAATFWSVYFSRKALVSIFGFRATPDNQKYKFTSGSSCKIWKNYES